MYRKINVIDADGSNREGRRMMEFVKNYHKANQDIADAAVRNFRECFRREAAAGKHSIDFKPNRSNSPMPSCGGVLLYDSWKTKFEDHEDAYDQAQDEILPLIQKELSAMGLDHCYVTLWKFNPTQKLFHAYLGFRIQANW